MNKKILFLLAFFAFGLSADPYKDILNSIRKLGRSVEELQSVEVDGNNIYVIVKFDTDETSKKNVIFVSRDNGQNFMEKTIIEASEHASFEQIAMCNDVLYVTQREFSPYNFRVFAWYNTRQEFNEIPDTDIEWCDCAKERDMIIGRNL